MTFGRYPAYKDSGVEWLGEVPSHWSVIKLGRRLHAAPCYGVLVPDFDPDGVPMLRITDMDSGNTDRAGLTTISRALSDEYARSVVREGDVVLSVVGTIGQTLEVGSALAGVNLSRAVARLQLSTALSARFLCWVFRSLQFKRYVDLVCVGTAQRVLNMSDVVAFQLATPELWEQALIADCLERETSKIDALIEDQKRLIELINEKRQAAISQAVVKGLDVNVRMKDSGVEWLGQVPAHWQTSRLANLFFDADQRGNEDLPVLTVSIHDGVSDDELDEAEMDRKVTRSDDKTKYKTVQPGDLVYNMMRAWQGGFGSVRVDGMVSPAYVVARPRTPFPTEFVESLLRTPNAIEEMRGRSRGVTDFRLRLYWEEFKEIVIPLPPKHEVEAILGHLHDLNARTDETIAAAEECIQVLKERRVALISAAITGKIDVRNVVADTELAAA